MSCVRLRRLHPVFFFIFRLATTFESSASPKCMVLADKNAFPNRSSKTFALLFLHYLNKPLYAPSLTVRLHGLTLLLPKKSAFWSFWKKRDLQSLLMR